jgi:cytochrome c553
LTEIKHSLQVILQVGQILRQSAANTNNNKRRKTMPKRASPFIARVAVMPCSLVAVSLGLLSRLLKLVTAPLLFLVLFTVAVVAQDDPTLDEELMQALDLESNLENGKELFLNCVGCHTPEAWGSANGVFPQIAGQHRSVIIKQIADIRLGNRDNPTMLPFAQENILGGPQGFSDVAGYIASLPMNPEPGTGQGKDLEHGEKLYKKNCAKCHGDNGEGDDGAFFPRVQGQHYEYLLRQLKWIREGKRRNVYRGMVRKTRKMTVTDFEAVSDYISRLPPPSDKLGPSGWKNPDFHKVE